MPRGQPSSQRRGGQPGCLEDFSGRDGRGCPRAGTRARSSIAITRRPIQMLQKLMERRRKGSEEGFTLIELMVVVLIIAILIAIAIPTFLGARQRANNRAAQSSLRNALTAAHIIFTDNNDSTAATAGAVSAVEPSLTFVANTASSSGPKTVSVKPVSATEWVATVWS